MKVLVKEVFLSGLCVNVVVLGVIEMEMLSVFFEEDKMGIVEDILLGRIGLLEEVVKIVLFFVLLGVFYIIG